MHTTHPLTPQAAPFGEDHSATQAHQEAPKRGRGRPTVEHDNRRVAEFLTAGYLLRALDQFDDDWVTPPWESEVASILTGVSWLRTTGPKEQDSTRALSPRRIRRVLMTCPFISTQAAARALGEGTGASTVERYTLHARVASKAIARLLDQHPAWETELSARASFDGWE